MDVPGERQGSGVAGAVAYSEEHRIAVIPGECPFTFLPCAGRGIAAYTDGCGRSAGRLQADLEQALSPAD